MLPRIEDPAMPMGRTFRVAIDDVTLRANISREEQRVVSEREVRRWLRAAGFKLVGHHWLVCECDLGHLLCGPLAGVKPEPQGSAEAESSALRRDLGTDASRTRCWIVFPKRLSVESRPAFIDRAASRLVQCPPCGTFH
jgi:hypothetical protein